MRYLSEDGKLFNTEDECKEHEDKIKKEKEEAENAKMKEKEESQALLSLMKKLDDLRAIYNDLEEEMDKYEKTFNTSFRDKNKKLKNEDSASDMLFDFLKHI